jgi:NAD(P)-dependent dehydrogenase (short-subunit alcohol dehydrogenase family)
LAGRVAIVAVAGDGTSEAVARTLAAAGAAVVLVAPPDALAAAGGLAAEIESAGIGRAAVFALDPVRPHDIDGLDGLVEMVAELFG